MEDECEVCLNTPKDGLQWYDLTDDEGTYPALLCKRCYDRMCKLLEILGKLRRR